jgi:hypothetical protein
VRQARGPDLERELEHLGSRLPPDPCACLRRERSVKVDLRGRAPVVCVQWFG